jgi:hypothetical protein
MEILKDFGAIGLNCGDGGVWSCQSLLSDPGLMHEVPAKLAN